MTLKYSGAGDLPLFYKESGSGKIGQVSTQGSLLGFAEDGKFEDISLNLNKGDSIFMVTDGIMESRNSSGEPLGLQKFHQVISETNSHKDDFQIIKHEFESFTGGRFDDDISVLNIKVL
jgi:serine phosphatase RsbU (regulator of sigma subunit)